MTLHLTLLRPGHIVQVSDRLVTLSGSKREHDPAANKTIILRTPDSVASICYTGHAYAGDAPTDYALARAILGKNFRPCGLPRDPYHYGRVFLDRPIWGQGIGDALHRALHVLRGELALEPRLGNEPAVIVSATGWKWPTTRAVSGNPYVAATTEMARLARPFHWEFRVPHLGPIGASLNRGPVKWLLNKPQPSSPERGLLGAMPSVIDNEQLDQMQAYCLDSDCFNSSAVRLLECFNHFAANSGVIGKNVSVLVLPHPWVGVDAQFTYVGHEPTPELMASPIPTPTAHYAPWVIHPAATYGPSILVGRQEPIDLAGYQLRLSGGPSDENGWTWAAGGQLRRQPPGRN